MQTDRDALLAGILADPDADLPRLVFADWLEETGHPANCARAEYIRLAIELSKEPADSRGRRPDWTYDTPHNYNCQNPKLDPLKSMFHDEWDIILNATEVPIETTLRAMRARGFVEVIWLSTNYLTSIVPRLCSACPVTQLSIEGRFRRTYADSGPEDVVGLDDSLASHGAFTQVDFFAVIGVRPIFAALFARKASQCLRILRFSDSSLGDEDIVWFVQALRDYSSLQRLESLSIAGEMTDHAAHTLAAADWPPSFRGLNIDGTRITNAGREVLFRRFGFEELRPRLALS